MCRAVLYSLCIALLLICSTWARSTHHRKKRPKLVVPLIGCDLRARKVNYPEFIARCPPKCSESRQPVYGSGVYASISSICNAAIHSGVITDKGGKVMVKKVAGRPLYRGNFSHGVHSLSLPRWKESFTVAAGKPKRGVIYPSVLVDTTSQIPSLNTDLKPARLSSASDSPSTSTTTIATPPIATLTATADIQSSTISTSTTASTTASTTTLTTLSSTTMRSTASVTSSTPTTTTTMRSTASVTSSTPTTTTTMRSTASVTTSTPTTSTTTLSTTTTRMTPTTTGGAITPPIPYYHPISPYDMHPFDIQQPWDDGFSMKDWLLPLYLYPDWFTHRGHPSGPPYFYQSIPLFSGDQFWSSDLGPLSPASGQHVERSFPRTSSEMSGFFLPQDTLPGDPGSFPHGDLSCMVDIAFLIDGSWNIGGRRFQIQKDFLVEVAQVIGVGTAGPLMGVIQYGDYAVTEFGLKAHLDPTGLKGAIERIVQRGGPSNVGKALAYVNANYFTAGNGNRGRAPNVAVVLVDGWSSDRVDEASRLARESGVNVFLVSVEGGGAGEREKMAEADKVVCRPGSFFSLPVGSWFNLRDSVRLLAERLCSIERLACSRTCPNAHDLAFLVDGSSSLGHAHFATLLRFVANVTRAFEISPTDTRVGLVQYTYEQRLEIGLGQHTSRQELLDAILGVRYWSGGTSTGAAISFASERIFGQAKGSKQKVLVVVTDGRSYDDVRAPALVAQQAGVIIYSIGVAWAIQEQLEDIASDPVSEHSFFVDDFVLLHKLVPTIIQNICQEFNSKPQN